MNINKAFFAAEVALFVAIWAYIGFKLVEVMQ